MPRIVLTLWMAGGLVYAQSPAGAKPRPEFEVASVKPFTGGGRGWFPSQDAGQFNWQGATLRQLIVRAYNVDSSDQVTGPDGSIPRCIPLRRKFQRAQPEDVEIMLQNVLAERFRLAVHRETKVIDGYDLVVAKGGPKLKDSVAAASGGRGSFGPDGATLTRNRVTMSGIALFLAMEISFRGMSGNPDGQEMVRVVDKTGLTETYDVALHYVPRSDTPGDDIFSAIQNQLGLSLKPTKIRVDMVVVDHAEKTPTEN